MAESPNAPRHQEVESCFIDSELQDKFGNLAPEQRIRQPTRRSLDGPTISKTLSFKDAWAPPAAACATSSAPTGSSIIR